MPTGGVVKKCEIAEELPVAAELKRDRPVMIWDGDCAFCAKRIGRLEKITGDKIQYAPYQFLKIDDRGILKNFTVAVEDARRSVQLVMPTGERYEAAEAIFRAFDYAGKQRFWLRFYKYFPGFKFLAEAAYRFVAGHRFLF